MRCKFSISGKHESLKPKTRAPRKRRAPTSIQLFQPRAYSNQLRNQAHILIFRSILALDQKPVRIASLQTLRVRMPLQSAGVPMSPILPLDHERGEITHTSALSAKLKRRFE